MTDDHTLEGQIERAKRLREHIAGLDKAEPAQPKSLKEQIDERSAAVAAAEKAATAKE